MEIPASLYGDYGAVAKRSRRAIRRCLRGEQGLWDALATGGMVDPTDGAEPIVLEGPDPLRNDEMAFRCGLPLYLLVTDARANPSPDLMEDIFTTGLDIPWGLLCLFDRQTMYGWFPESVPYLRHDRFGRYVRAVLRHWAIVDAVGARYVSYAGDHKERLAHIALGGGCALLYVLANLGVPHELLRRPLPEIGGLYALLARADPARAADLVALGQSNETSWRALPVNTVADEAEDIVATLPEGVEVSTEMSAAMHANNPAAVQRLIEVGEPVDRSDLDLLRTPLLWAAEGGYTELAGFLLDRGANIEDWADEGESPLMLAARKGHAHTVRLLLERGADPNYVTDNWWDAVMFAKLGGHDDLASLIEQARSSSRRGR